MVYMACTAEPKPRSSLLPTCTGCRSPASRHRAKAAARLLCASRRLPLRFVQQGPIAAPARCCPPCTGYLSADRPCFVLPASTPRTSFLLAGVAPGGRHGS
jgi:hypothetical protein